MTKENKNKLIGIISTVFFHTIAIVLLFVLCFKTPLPLPGEAGVEVNLGMYAETSSSQQFIEPTNQQVNETVDHDDVEDETEDITSDDENAPSIEEQETDETKEEETIEETVEEIEEKPIINERALFHAPKDNTMPTSEGDSEGQGEQGNPDGLKDIDRYEGKGESNNGTSYDLGGRGAKSISSPNKDFKEEGVIVVDIYVDRDGRVQRAEIGKGTDITDTTLRESAILAAKNSIFNKDNNAADLQKGTITYRFIIRE